ncbi:PREDICTED: pyrimidodiazepine synthase-like [Dufourea novaeangliae]|uniref:Glutathione S-transferase omega-1 n=1 Tax=Dufourea novaeangliae TaxID=178035 RepID=A0A154PA51_DUFNO|nr:PREDICTED: pyrimidodiazepine synthase-like [Dufourea novaeangliae]KZC08264.1 Glutathione S-transferase omega-1 [Dufourea novaeangliae]
MSSKHLAAGSVAQPIVPGKIRLYSMRFCPYAQRIHLVLDAKNIPYDVVYINLISKPDWFLEKSCFGKVPCVELEEGETLYESLVIAEYLDEAYPQNKLYPNNPLAKARDKLLIDRFNSVINTMYKLYLNIPTERDVFEEALAGLEVFEKELATRATPFFSGNSPGMLDFMIWPWWERSDVMKVLRGEQFVMPRDRFKKLLEWKSGMKKNSAVKNSYLDTEVHAKFMQSRLAGIPQYDLVA